MEPTAPELQQDRAEAFKLVPVSRETSELLDQFVELFLPWTARTNLIARSTIPSLWTRHIADSLQLVPLAPDAKTWIDLGCGAGFPGLMIACALKGRPGAQVHLVESIGKKAAFLREAVQQLSLPAEVHAVRIEDFGKNFRTKPDAVTARALAPLENLLGLAQPLLRHGTIGLFPKGQDVVAELTQASKCWTINFDLIPSKTSREGRIVVVRSLSDNRKKTNSNVRSRP